MIDYLELVVGGTANALLAAQQHADRAAAAVFFRVGSTDTAGQETPAGRLPAGGEPAFPMSLARTQLRNGDASEEYRVSQRGQFADLGDYADARMQRERKTKATAADWQGQLERKLRRDSRRYDAGFFLY